MPDPCPDWGPMEEINGCHQVVLDVFKNVIMENQMTIAPQKDGLFEYRRSMQHQERTENQKTGLFFPELEIRTFA